MNIARLLTGLALLGAVLASGVAAPLSRAGAADAACPPQVLATLTNVSRAIVPIGVRVVRGFTVDAAADVTLSNVQLTAPTEYVATQITANKAYGLRFTAPHAGDFAVQATWTETYTDDTGVAVTLSGAGTSTLTAAKGSTLTITPPAATKFPAADHVTGTQYNAPVTWRWKCKADTDPTPMKVTVRWEWTCASCRSTERRQRALPVRQGGAGLHDRER